MGIRISQLSANALPYTGRELIPLVQSSTTRAGTLSSFINYLSGALMSDAELQALSNKWDSTHTTVKAESGNWDKTYTLVNTESGNWDKTYTLVNTESGNWDKTYTLVNTESGTWASGGLATTLNHLSTNAVTISAATIQGILSTSVTVTDLVTNKTFKNNDTGRIFHFDTTSGGLTAIFPVSLSNGFNVAIMNTGSNVLRLSATQLYAVGQGIAVKYGAAFVYKENGKIFAVGRL